MRFVALSRATQKASHAKVCQNFCMKALLSILYACCSAHLVGVRLVTHVCPDHMWLVSSMEAVMAAVLQGIHCCQRI